MGASGTPPFNRRRAGCARGDGWSSVRTRRESSGRCLPSLVPRMRPRCRRPSNRRPSRGLRPARENEGKRRIVIERGHEAHRLQGGEHRHSVRECVEGAIFTLAQALHRVVRIDADRQACAKRARLREIRNMPSVQQVEHAVCEHERARKARRPGGELLLRAQLMLERNRGALWRQFQCAGQVCGKRGELSTRCIQPAISCGSRSRSPRSGFFRSLRSMSATSGYNV